ncbi:MAG: hypothetical protein Q8O19_05895, partial [Rectinemataceae bacterium]|nr:hypothetical protein [Rectinemataceae bacterium]
VFTKEEEERDVYRCQVEAERLANSIRGEVTRKGLAEGLAQGKIEGMRLASLENAGKMKALGIPLATIIAVTGISEEDMGKV